MRIRRQIEGNTKVIYATIERPEQLLTIGEVAERLGYRNDNTAPVRKLIDKGYLTTLKLGRLRIRESEVDRFIKENDGKDLSHIFKD